MSSFKARLFSNKAVCKSEVAVSLSKLNSSNLMVGLGIRMEFLPCWYNLRIFRTKYIIVRALQPLHYIASVLIVKRQPRSGSEAHYFCWRKNVFVRINLNGKSPSQADVQLGVWVLFSATMHTQAAPTIHHLPYAGDQPAAALAHRWGCSVGCHAAARSICHLAGPPSSSVEGALPESTRFGNTKFK